MSYEHEIVVAFGKNRADKNWKNEYLTWGDFVEKCKHVRYTSETLAEYDKMSKDQKAEIKDGAAYVGGFVAQGIRKKENIQSRSIITLDVDFGTEDFLFDLDIALGGNAYFAYSTHSYRNKALKYRLNILVDREMSPDEYAACIRKVAYLVGMDYFDKTSFDINRLMYFPSCSKDAEPHFIEEQGDPLSVDDLLAMYEDWTDPTQWDRHKSEKDIRKPNSRMEDPRNKPGVIGAFCRQYSITEAIETFIPDIYTPTDIEDRWTYHEGSSVGGLVIYDQDTFAYSHHESDPISEREVNAFDLIRIHKFRDLDDDVSKNTNVTKYPSYQAMIDFAMKDQGVMREVAAEDFGDMVEDEEDLDWLAKLERDKKNNILSNSRNIELILTHGTFKNVLAYDEFGNSEMVRAALPWRGRKFPNKDYEPWLGSDDRRIVHYFNKTYDIKSEGMIRNALTEVVHMNSFHPVKEYLESQKWDGAERLERLFIDYLGAENTLYVKEVTRKMFLAAVKRIYEPGCKFDEMLVLVGPQGVGKSSLLAKMGRSWFSDSIKRFEPKEAGEHLQGTWIVEIGELAAMKKSEIEEVKQFLSKLEDKYRVAFDRVVTGFPRKCVFFGTTNNRNFLYDPTGNRRFWPVDVGVKVSKYNHFKELTDDIVCQMWAEALSWYKKGESLTLSDEGREEAKKQQEAHFEVDTREGLIARYLETPLPENWDAMEDYERQEYLENPTGTIERKITCVAEIWVECLGKNISDLKPWESKPIADIVRRIPGWQDRKPTRANFKRYGKQTAFIKVGQ